VPEPQAAVSRRGYGGAVITSVLGAPGAGKSTIAPLLAGLLPRHVVLDWDAFMAPAAALAGEHIPDNPGTWPAYRALLRAVVGSIAHVPVVLLGVCTPLELAGWPIDAWILLDCADRERRRRLGRHARPHRVAGAIGDARNYRTLGLPVIDTTGRTPETAAAELARYIQTLEHDQQPVTDPGS
jgi:energy-coupling factor transporter ATP-binding protein EcfA2